MANTTSGEKAEGPTAKPGTAGSSATSAQSAKRSTKPTKEFTLGEALEILTQAFSIVEDAGGDLDVGEGADFVTVNINGVKMIDGLIVPIPRADISAQTGS